MAGLGENVPPREVITAVEGTPDHIAGLEAIEKAKGDAKATVAALKKVAAVPNKKAAEILTTHLKDEEQPEAVRKTALELFGKQRESANEVVPFLTHKSMAFKTAASTALKSQGIVAIPALLESLESEDAEMRFASFQVAAAITKDSKVSRDGPLWKSGKPADREKAIAAWKAWYEKARPPIPKK